MTPKPSGTNCPYAFTAPGAFPRDACRGAAPRWGCRRHPPVAGLAFLSAAHVRWTAVHTNDTNGGYGPGVPPLPIPNREVKPGRADGTAPQCGRVGRRLPEGPPRSGNAPGRAFFVLLSCTGVFGVYTLLNIYWIIYILLIYGTVLGGSTG